MTISSSSSGRLNFSHVTCVSALQLLTTKQRCTYANLAPGCDLCTAADAAVACIYADRVADPRAGHWCDYCHLLAGSLGHAQIAAGGGSFYALPHRFRQELLRGRRAAG